MGGALGLLAGTSSYRKCGISTVLALTAAFAIGADPAERASAEDPTCLGGGYPGKCLGASTAEKRPHATSGRHLDDNIMKVTQNTNFER